MLNSNNINNVRNEPPPSIRTSLKTKSLRSIVTPGFLDVLADQTTVDRRTLDFWMEGERTPPAAFTRLCRNALEKNFPEIADEIAVPGDPEYKELRAREKEDYPSMTPLQQQIYLMKKAGYTINTLALKVKCTPYILKQILTGRTPTFENFDYPILALLPKALGVEMDAFPWRHKDQISVALQATKLAREFEAKGMSDKEIAEFGIAEGARLRNQARDLGALSTVDNCQRYLRRTSSSALVLKHDRHSCLSP